MDNKNNQPQTFQPFLLEKKFTQYETTAVAKQHHFYISEEVGEPKDYVDMIHTIKTALPSDTIYLYLNTPGGRIDTGVQIISAIRNTEAHVITSIEGEVCSLGTLLFLSGHEFMVNDHCLFMIHNFSGGTYGKGHEQAARLEGTIKWFTQLAKEIYIPFLTEEELDSVIDGKDLWMGSEEVRKRLTNMVKILKKEARDAQRASK